MKLRNWLPTKYLTEENPVIGLSFEVGYARIAVMVGQTIIHTMSNMLRADFDSRIFRCIPAYMHRSYMSDAVLANKHHPMEGGFHRRYPDLLEIHSALTNFEIYNKSGSMSNVGTVGHVDHGKTPTYLTHHLYEKEMRRAAVEAGFGELDYMQRKLLNNGHSGITRKVSGHSSLTAACLAKPKYRLTDTHGGMGVIVPVHPYEFDVITHKASLRLGEKYYFTGEGMLPKDL